MKVSILLAAAAVVALTIPALAQAPAPSATTPAPSAKPAAPAPAAAAKPATTGAATRAEQFKTEADAKKGCKTDAVVWVVSASHHYYPAESKDFGKAKDGVYMCKADAERAGNKPAKDEKKG